MSRIQHLKYIDAICDEFEARLAEGEAAAIEEFLEGVAEADHEPLLRELLAIELEFRREASESPSIEEYQTRFPSYSRLIQRVFAEMRQQKTRDMRDDSSIESRPRLPDRIAGHLILEEIARGGMGVVYHARQENLNREVALKMIIAGTFASPERRKRFHDEAKAVANLQHPNIVQVYELDEFEGEPFISLEYVSGGNLSEQLGEPKDVQWTLDSTLEICAAVEHAHQRGIIHRDLKPSNILVTKDGVLKIADFGLAKQLEDQSGTTQTGEVLGTPNYMAPEQAAGKPELVGPGTDVYAIGTLMFEMLTGRTPFQHESAWVTVNSVIGSPPPLPTRFEQSIPKPLEAIVLKCLAKQPGGRYASVSELVADLQRFRDNEPVTARHRTTTQVWRTVGISVAVIAVLLGGVSLWGKFSSAKNDTTSLTREDSGTAATWTNPLGMQFALVPAGEFRMGAGQFVPGDPDDQVPQHVVRITKPFYMGIHEVTVRQFREFVSQTDFPIGGGIGFDNETGLIDKSGRLNWENPGWRQSDNHPVTNVSWEDATAFCSWLSEEEGQTYRLPTEAEWEYACRAGTGTVYFTGDDSVSLKAYANVCDRSYRRMMETFNEEGYYDYTQPWNDGFPFTAPVGQFKPNPFGLYDMHGNVQEWCHDWYEQHHYTKDSRTDPVGPTSGTHRVKRGGDWTDYINICRSSFRRSELTPDHRTLYVGFRVVREQ